MFPLYAALPAEQQAEVFKPVPNDVRKVVVCTNIAETSVTVPGIRFVIDPGFSREKYYDARTGIDGLDTVRISKVSAQQRAGRAGRFTKGACYRLMTEDDYEKLEKRDKPEVMRLLLCESILLTRQLGIQNEGARGVVEL